jgi:hypothetical protein
VTPTSTGCSMPPTWSKYCKPRNTRTSWPEIRPGPKVTGTATAILTRWIWSSRFRAVAMDSRPPWRQLCRNPPARCLG